MVSTSLHVPLLPVQVYLLGKELQLPDLVERAESTVVQAGLLDQPSALQTRKFCMQTGAYWAGSLPVHPAQHSIICMGWLARVQSASVGARV